MAPKPPTTSTPAPEDPHYPYLLRGLKIDRVNQVWAADITYIPLAHGFAYLVAIMDWHSLLRGRTRRSVEAFPRTGDLQHRPGRTVHGRCVHAGAHRQVRISMDGKGRYLDSIFIERLWRSLKYEDVYLYAYDDVTAARAGIGCYLTFCNERRPHQALGYQTPAALYDTTPTGRRAA